MTRDPGETHARKEVAEVVAHTQRQQQFIVGLAPLYDKDEDDNIIN